MKKLLFILSILSCLTSNAQIVSIYKKIPKYDCILYHGLHSEYLDILTLFQQTDSATYRYDYSSHAIWIGYSGAAIYPGLYTCTDGVNFEYLDTAIVSAFYVSNQINVYPPYPNNINGYSRMVDTLGGAGNGKIMPTAAAQSSIASINTSIGNKADKSTTLTINGTSLNLSANRSWTVGDVLTGGSYSNPSWINSLAYSKLTGTPSIPAAQVNSDWNSVSGLSQILNKPTIPTNTNQLTNGSSFVDAAGARFAISLTTTGSSGASTYNSSTGVLNVPQYISPTLSFNNAPGRSVVATTGATGFQVSSTRASLVNYSVTISTTVSLSGNSTGYVALQICSTNSATAGDWIEVARTASGQSGTLVVGLTLNQTGGGNLSGVVPAGYYAKILSVNTAGTPTYTYNSGQEVLFN